jgi:hypothetical protein
MILLTEVIKPLNCILILKSHLQTNYIKTMKSRAILEFIILALIIILSCKKVDFRDKYFGNWVFKIYDTMVVFLPLDTTLCDSSCCHGKIVYGVAYNEIKLLCSTTNKTVTLNKDGVVITGDYSQITSSTIESGKFESADKIYYKFYQRQPQQFRIITKVIYGEREN